MDYYNAVSYTHLQSIRREAGEGVSFNQLEQAARKEASFPSRVDVNASRFLAPENMGEAVRALCRETGQPVPETLGQLASCVYHSLAPVSYTHLDVYKRQALRHPGQPSQRDHLGRDGRHQGEVCPGGQVEHRGRL